MLCFVLFALSSLSVHSSFFSVLVMGRVMAGIASSLLQTVFDSWMLAEHYNFAYPDEWLAQTYQQVASGTTIVVVGAGLVSEAAAALGGISGLFDVSLVLALSGLALVMLTWTRENFAAPVTIAGFCDAPRPFRERDPVLAPRLLPRHSTGVLRGSNPHRSLHVGARPLYERRRPSEARALSTPSSPRPRARRGRGLGRATAVRCDLLHVHVELDARIVLFQLVARVARGRWRSLGRLACVTASVAMVVLAAVQSRALVLLAFLVFEVCKGVCVYYPVVGTLRGQYIPMEVRTIISQCSKPVLGAAVLVLLLNFAELSSIIFVLCAVLLSMAAWCQHQLIESKAVPDGSSAAVGGEVVATVRNAASGPPRARPLPRRFFVRCSSRGERRRHTGTPPCREWEERKASVKIEIPGRLLFANLNEPKHRSSSGSRALAWNTMSTVYPAETADIHPATFVTLRFSLDRMGHVKDAESRRTHVKAERLKETTRAIGNTLTRAALHDAGAVETARAERALRALRCCGWRTVHRAGVPSVQEPPATKRRWRFTRLAKSVAHAKQVSRLAVSKESRAHQSHVFADELFKIRVAGEAQRAGDEHLCVLTRDRMRNEERALAERTQALAARRLARRERGAACGSACRPSRAVLSWARGGANTWRASPPRAGGHVLAYDDGSVCMRQPIPERLERVLQPYLEDSAQIVDEPVASDPGLAAAAGFCGPQPGRGSCAEYFFVSFDDGSAVRGPAIAHDGPAQPPSSGRDAHDARHDPRVSER